MTGTHRSGVEPSNLPAARTGGNGAAITAARISPIPPSVFITLLLSSPRLRSRRCSERDRVTTASHACAERLVVVGATLSHGVLLLSRIVHLLLLLLLGPSVTANGAEQTADGGPDRGSLSRIATDRAPDGSHRGASQAAAEEPALRRARHRRRTCRHLWIGGIEPGLLDGPAVALAPVELLLLRILAAGGIDIRLRRGDGRDAERHSAHHAARDSLPTGHRNFPLTTS